MFGKKRPDPADWGIQDHLLDELKRLFPDASPQLGTPPEEVWFRAGQASVVRKLEQMQQQE